MNPSDQKARFTRRSWCFWSVVMVTLSISSTRIQYCEATCMVVALIDQYACNQNVQPILEAISACVYPHFCQGSGHGDRIRRNRRLLLREKRRQQQQQQQQQPRRMQGAETENTVDDKDHENHNDDECRNPCSMLGLAQCSQIGCSKEHNDEFLSTTTTTTITTTHLPQRELSDWNKTRMETHKHLHELGLRRVHPTSICNSTEIIAHVADETNQTNLKECMYLEVELFTNGTFHY